MTMFPTRHVAAQMIIEVGKRLWQRGFIPANDAAISVKLASGKFLITPTGVYNGFLEEEMLVVVDLDGRVLSANLFYRPSADHLLHLRVFRNNPMALGVIHAQPPYATAFAAAGRSLTNALLPYTAAHLGVVPVSPYATPGTAAAADAVAPYLSDHNALLLGNRGALAWGSNLYEAYTRLETLEQYAQVTHLTEQLTHRPPLIGAGHREALGQLRKQAGFPRGGSPRFAAEGAGKLRVAVVGAAGKAGSKILREARCRGHDVTAFVRHPEKLDAGNVNIVGKDLFALTVEDLAGFDVVVNAFGAFDSAHLNQNTQAIAHFASILAGRDDVRLLVVGGSGCLFLDEERTKRLRDKDDYQAPYQREVLPIALAFGEALEALKRTPLNWTYVSCAADFRYDAPRTGVYQLGGDILLVNSVGNSEVSYEDYALAFVDELENRRHERAHISVCSL